MNHTSSNDNITATFSNASHAQFSVGGVDFAADACNNTVNTYINNASSGTENFEEVALTDATNIVYATILEDDEEGYDGGSYDFQMIVPEIGLASFSGATAFYMYIEIGN